MKLCEDPYAIGNINLDEYIGTSLFTINSNFAKLSQEICRLDDQVKSLIPDYNTFNTGMSSLSVLTPGFAKAWVRFNGVGNGSLSRYSFYRVSNVTGTGSGIYTINFSPSFTGTNYALIGTCAQSTTTNNYGWVEPVASTFNSSSVNIVIRNTTGGITTSKDISILVYEL